MHNNEHFKEEFSLPLVSFIIPTYNAEKTLKTCLDRIFAQDYPKGSFEVLVIDGGSADKTLEITLKYPVKILYNRKPLPYNQEGTDGGKALGLSVAKGELVAFIDADNMLVSDDWLRKMVQPFIEDSEIVACETSRFVNRRDAPINRYCSALITKTPRKDPFVLSSSSVREPRAVNKKGVIIYRADLQSIPCLANGTVVRKDILQKIGGYDYDWDTGRRMIKMGYNKLCKVISVGIYHKYVESSSALIRKGVWRMRYLLYSAPNRPVKKSFSSALADRRSRLMLVGDFVSGLTLIGPLVYAIRKLKEEGDYAWLYHPLVYFIIPLIYVIVLLTTRRGISLILTGAKGSS
jgi:glycosyltransferase involved in cell wall biosynthesis